jgi:mRNA-degrading endonuclease RelE of RelBE toxin-antitoxin system
MFGEVVTALEAVKESLDGLPERIAGAIVKALREEAERGEGQGNGNRRRKGTRGRKRARSDAAA